jgi:hypothetical protein
MKNFVLVVVLAVSVLFSSKAFCYTFEGSFDPAQLLKWNWEIVYVYPEESIFRVKATNPEVGALPQKVTFLVEVVLDEHLTTHKKLLLYIIEGDAVRMHYLLGENNHFHLELEEPVEVVAEQGHPDDTAVHLELLERVFKERI